MAGRVNVLPAGAHGPSPAQVQKQVDNQIKRDLKGAWTADAKANRDAERLNRKGTTRHVIAGTSSPDGHVALLEFFPRTLDATAGDKVVFTPRSPDEPHTVTFPGDLGNEFQPFCENGSVDVPMGPTGCNFGPPDEIEFDGGNGVTQLADPTTIAEFRVHRAVQAHESHRAPEHGRPQRVDGVAGGRRSRHVHVRLPDPRRDGGDRHGRLNRTPWRRSGHAVRAERGDLRPRPAPLSFFSIRMAVALNSAVPDFGSVASIVSRLTATSSWKCMVMNVRPGRSDGSIRTGTSTWPRRETTRTTSPSARP